MQFYLGGKGLLFAWLPPKRAVCMANNRDGTLHRPHTYPHGVQYD